MADTGPSPIEPRTERARNAAEVALVWLSIAAAMFVVWQLAQALLVIFAGLIFAAGLQGGERLLGKIWPSPRWLRLTIVVLTFVAVVAGFVAFAGVSLATQSQQLQDTLNAQASQLSRLARDFGFHVGRRGDVVAALKAQVGMQLGQVTLLLGSALSALGGVLLAVTLGIYVAADPRLYERGIEWLTPEASRDQVGRTLAQMGYVLRRWVLGRLIIMLIEGIVMFVGLSLTGVPLAALLGLVAGLLAFVPTLGAIIAGVLIVAVGFSAGVTTGLWSVAIYLIVILFEGNVLTPVIEKRTVDLAPAVVLAAQLLFGVLFGILGVALADPLVALIKVALERRGAARAALIKP